MDEERVEYSFTGDASSLKSATREAIDALSKYENTIKKMAAGNQFDVSKTSFSGFQRTLNGLIKQTNSLTKFMNTASKETQKALIPDTDLVKKAVIDIQDVLDFLQSSTQLTSNDMKLMNSVLKDASNAMGHAAMRAQALGSSYSKIAQLEAQTASKSEEVSERLSSSYVKMLQNKPFVEYAKQVDASFGKVKKSAQESMQFFMNEGRLGGLSTGIKNVADKLIQMRTTLDGAVERVKTKISSMTRVFNPITAKIQSFKDKGASAMNYVRMLSESVAHAFRRVAGSADEAEAEADQSAKAHKSLGNVLKKLGPISKGAVEGITSLGKALGNAASRFKSLISNTHGMSSATSKLRKTVRELLTMKLGSWISSGIKSSINFTENLNLFNVAMGKSADRGHEFVKQMSEVYGMDPNNLLKNAGYFYQLTDAIGMADKASATLSLSLTKASNDIASLFNVDVQTVVDDLASGMQGMSRSVRKYGMDIRATTLEQTALSLGFHENVETTSEANRMALRFITMMKQVKNATTQVTKGVDGAEEVMGDFARTIEQPANQLRIFKEQISQLGRSIGNFFIPHLEKILPLVNGLVMALRTALTYIGTLIGVTEKLSGSASDLEDNAGAIEDIESSANDATKALKKMLAPFDELNVLNEESSSNSGSDLLDAKLQEAIENMYLGLENINMKANEIRDKILNFFGFETENGTVVSWSKELFLKGIEELKRDTSKLAKKLAEQINNIIKKLPVDKIGKNIGQALSTSITTGVAFINNLDLRLLGEKVADFFLQSVKEIDFKALGELCMTKFKVIAEFFGGVVNAFNQPMENFSSGWAMVGTKVAEWFSGALNSIDWATLSADINSLILGLFEFIISALNNTDWEKVGESIAELLNGLDLQGIFNALLRVIQLVFEAIARSFKALWDNADPEVKVGIAAAVLIGLGKIIYKVIGFVKDLTGAFNKKNDSLEKQSGLESAASTVLSKKLLPALTLTTVGATLTAGAFGSMGDSLGQLSTPIENFSQKATESMDSVSTHALVAAGVLNTTSTQASQLDADPVESFCETVSKSFEEAAESISSATDSLKTFKDEAGLENADPNSEPTVEQYPWKPAAGIAEGIMSAGVAVGGWLTSAGEAIASIFPMLIDPRLIPTGPYGSANPQMATGGVVTSPTYALIGEGKYDEAVIPLGNSPQMRELVEEIAEASRSRGSDEPIQVNVYIGNEQVAEYMHRADRRRDLQTNGGT